MTTYSTGSLAGCYLALLIGACASTSFGPESQPHRQITQHYEDSNAACMQELRKMRAMLISIADTDPNAQTKELAKQNRAIVSAMIEQLREPDVHLNTQWLTTFQDLNYLVEPHDVGQRPQMLARLNQELKLKYQGGQATAGGLTKKAGFQQLAEVTVHAVNIGQYRPAYRVYYLRGSDQVRSKEPRPPQHAFENICQNAATDCQSALTPCFYLFWAVDIASKRVCSDSIPTRLGEGATKRIDLIMRKL